jgi:hypothetical protein
MNDPIESFLDSQRSILNLVDELLDGWKIEALYQVPQLLLHMGVRLNWDATQLRKFDPIVRAYLKDHPVWYVTRGAHGGIMRRDEHNKKENDKLTKLRAKEELKATLEAKAAAAASASVQIIEQDNT